MSGAADARASLTATLTGTGIRVLTDVMRSPDVPCLIVTMPTLTYDAYRVGPTEASFDVPLVVSSDDRTGEQLMGLLPIVEQAISDSEDAVLTGAKPGSWGSPPLPSYLLTIEVAVT